MLMLPNTVASLGSPLTGELAPIDQIARKLLNIVC